MSLGRSVPRRMTAVERAIALRGVDAFRTIPMDQLAYLAGIVREEVHPAGAVLFREGDPPGGLLVVLDGTVVLKRGDREAGEATAGETLGGWSLFDDHPRRATAVATSDVRALVLDREAFYDVLSDHVELLRSLLRDLARRALEVAGIDEGGS